MSLKRFIFVLSFLASSMLSAHPTKIEVAPAHLLPKAAKPRKYQTLNYPAPLPNGNTFLTGIRRIKNHHKKFYVSGYFTTADGLTTVPFVYRGELTGKGKWHTLRFPTSPKKTVTATYLYGPNNGKKSHIEVVGHYTTAENGPFLRGCLYRGSLDGSGKWKTLKPHSSEKVLNSGARSTMGGIVVGNYNTQPGVEKAFIYDIEHDKYHHIEKPGAVSITANGIWHNGGHSYTICGGYSNGSTSAPIVSGYLVNWNKESHEFSDWRSYNFENDPSNIAVTHFRGITTDDKGGYYLTGVWSGVLLGPERTFFVHIKGNKAKWSRVMLPGQLVTTGNSVYKHTVIGIYTTAVSSATNGFVSTRAW